ncbi:MAG: hypothetical protein K1566_06200 [Candidatus Thiodiazotropha sp. (ex. Lucinisca nassula)]|nr:hypothetical protein [Candidatus Thiodiazotropha sp. (ex. Lucinisca nassula)]
MCIAGSMANGLKQLQKVSCKPISLGESEAVEPLAVTVIITYPQTAPERRRRELYPAIAGNDQPP